MPVDIYNKLENNGGIIMKTTESENKAMYTGIIFPQGERIELSLENKYIANNGSILNHEKYLLTNIINIPVECTLLYTSDLPLTATIWACESDGSNLVKSSTTFSKDTELSFSEGYYRLNFHHNFGTEITDESANIELNIVNAEGKKIAELDSRVNELENRVNTAEAAINDFKSDMDLDIGERKYRDEIISVNSVIPGRTNHKTEIGDVHSISDIASWSHTKIDVAPKDRYLINVKRTASTYARYIIGLDENNVIIKNYIGASDVIEMTEVPVVIPDKVTTLIISTYAATPEVFDKNVSIIKKVPVSLSEQMQEIESQQADQDEKIAVLENDSILNFISTAEFNSMDSDMVNLQSTVVLY